MDSAVIMNLLVLGLFPLTFALTMATGSERKLYSYTPVACNHFRLLYVSSDEGEPSYDIRHVSIESPPTFSALSYTWDGQSPDRSLHLDDGATLKVTHNVERAIYHLNMLSKSKSYAIWIDGVCIDQENLKDKEAQVPLMGKIYTAAVRTVVWLGESTPQIEEALKASGALLSVLSKAPEVIALDERMMSSYGLPPVESQFWESLGHVLARSWFSRLWVLQEAVLAREIIFICGNTGIDFDILVNVVEGLEKISLTALPLFNTKIEHCPRGIVSPMTISGLRKHFVQSPRKCIEFTVLLLSSSDRGCSDPRDRIYALLGMSGPELQENVQIRYDVPPTEIYLDYARWEIQQVNGPNILLLACWKHPRPDMPSWCPDFDADPQLIPLGAGHSSDQYDAGTHPRINNPGNICFITCLPTSNMIKTLGLHVDKVLKTLPAIWRFSSDTDMGPDKAQASRCLAWERSCLELSQEVFNRPDTVPEEHWRTLTANKFGSNASIADRQHDYERVLQVMACVGHTHANPDNTSGYRKTISLTPAEMLGMLSFESSMNHAVQGRSFISTEQGRIGLVPSNARTGDMICVLFNVLTPLILRPRPYDENVHELIGESYVHGLMSGEAWDICGDEKIREILID